MPGSKRILRLRPWTWVALVLTAAVGRPAASAPDDEARIDEVLAGANGDSRIQFIELYRADSPRCWGSQRTGTPCFAGTVETQSRMRLLFFDTAGNEIGQFPFPSEPPRAGQVLVATAQFAAMTGAPRPDFIMPPLLNSLNGKVCLASNPATPQIPRRRQCLSYGKFAGDTEGAGRAAIALPIMHARSLTRTRNTYQNSDFVRSLNPSPTNSARATFKMPVAPLVAQGEVLFTHETFQGNGRTCATCHVATDSFALRRENVRLRFASLAQDSYDPLFIAETINFDFNLNTLTLAAPPGPGDLRGLLRGTTGRAKVLARTGPTTYLVYGGLSPALTGTVTDGVSSAAVAGVIAGDLDRLEDPRRMRLGVGENPDRPDVLRRPLIQENIDGFDRPPVFRKSPHLLNLRRTGPFGLSGELADLRVFSQGAIAQHFPRRLARVAGVDFRDATVEELKALEAFQLSLEHPAGPDPHKFNLDRYATTTLQKQGRAIFFGSTAKCSRCHSGALLNETDGSVGKPAGPAQFNTGVSRADVNERDDVPGEPGRDGQPHGREFDTPSLFHLTSTTPMFHDGAVGIVSAVIDFYNSDAFNDSPAGQAVGGIDLRSDPPTRAALSDFLQSLTARPYALTGGPVKFEDQVVGGGPGERREIVVTNTSDFLLPFPRLPACGITGPDAAEFAVVECPLAAPLPRGASRTITVTFVPTSAGTKNAVLEVGGLLSSGVDLVGTAQPPVETSGTVR